MRNILIFVVLAFLTVGCACAEGQAEEVVEQLLDWGEKVNYLGGYDTELEVIQEWFPGGVVTSEGWYTNGEDVSHIKYGSHQYVVKLIHITFGDVILIAPYGREWVYIHIPDDSTFIKINKAYFKKNEYRLPEKD